MNKPFVQVHKEQRPWGGFERFTLNQVSTVKVVTVQPGESISLQWHKNRDEYWFVLSGSGTVRINLVEHAAKAGDEFSCPRGILHRLEGGKEGMRLLEIAFGEFDEADIVRFEDRYGRK